MKLKRGQARVRAPRHNKKITLGDKERSEKELQKLLKEKSYKGTDQSNPL